MGLRVPTMLDYNACNRQTQMAIATTETLHHDLVAQRRDIVRVLNYCSETRRAFNGSVCVMAPWDGVWIFHGCMRGVDQCSDFGAASGDDHLLMPTASPQVNEIGQVNALYPVDFFKVAPSVRGATVVGQGQGVR